jgi:tRNA G10  N-methylase Trm11
MSLQAILILGRQPGLGLAEAESLFGADAVEPITQQTALIKKDPSEINFNRLGGSTRLCKLLTELPTTDWTKITEYIATELPKHVCCVPEGKIRLGISVIGKGPSPKAINATGLSLKKIVKAAGRSVRVVPNTASELNTAQVLHNQLTGPTGYELMIINKGTSTVLAQTVAVQDINAYAARDQKRPMRDARVGMLPPKLAQIIINLTGVPPDGTRLLDPFCGTGVLLQEAALMGFGVYGTDIDERMVRYSRDNLNWLKDSHDVHVDWFLETGDATSHSWQQPVDTIACETFLGRPLSALPDPATLQKIVQDCDTIHRKFLQNLATQAKSGFRACVAVPAWKTKSGFKHLPVLDSLEELGYNRLRFVHVGAQELIYHRPEQLVARELVILQRK